MKPLPFFQSSVTFSFLFIDYTFSYVLFVLGLQLLTDATVQAVASGMNKTAAQVLLRWAVQQGIGQFRAHDAQTETRVRMH